jgi:hypothetical protein
MENKLELRNKIIIGIRMALEKLIASSAKNDEYLVISKDGKIVRVLAKDLQQH